MAGFLTKMFTWWNGSTIGTDVFTRRFGKKVGEGWATRNTILDPEDVANAVLYAVTAPAHVAGELRSHADEAQIEELLASLQAVDGLCDSWRVAAGRRA